MIPKILRVDKASSQQCCFVHTLMTKTKWEKAGFLLSSSAGRATYVGESESGGTASAQVALLQGLSVFLGQTFQVIRRFKQLDIIGSKVRTTFSQYHWNRDRT